jgi:hypothetical protein
MMLGDAEIEPSRLAACEQLSSEGAQKTPAKPRQGDSGRRVDRGFYERMESINE